MKRHNALTPLSREHHSALILAQLLKKGAPVYTGLPSDPEGKAAYALNMYTTILQKHFLKEEEILSKVKKYHAEIEIIGDEIIAEHIELKVGFLSLAKTDELVNALNNLGVALEKHIRKEERILFPQIQEHCPEEILNEIMLL